MKRYVLFGAKAMSLGNVADKIEKALVIKLALHDSSFWNGDYYLFESPNFALKVVRNELDAEGERIEEGFPLHTTLVYLDGFTKNALQSQLASINGLEELRTEQL